MRPSIVRGAMVGDGVLVATAVGVDDVGGCMATDVRGVAGGSDVGVREG